MPPPEKSPVLAFPAAMAVADPVPVRALAVIPARWGSTRFPGKALALLAGRPLIQHVVEAALGSRAFAQVVVATDDERIAEAVRRFGGLAELTSPAHHSGTDRVAELVSRLPDDAPGVVVNLQGDEPLVHPEALRSLVEAFQDVRVEMATLVRPLKDAAERLNPHVVKVVPDARGDALYFSRADIPYGRDGARVPRFAHVGLYGYRRATLVKLAQLPPGTLERAESLEQLRALEHGIRIRCVRTEHLSIGVDTPTDLARAEAALALRASSS
jgi:3-deoxy-manno-octulosonate cytidylyltransferase (CMP-KDO synthetase)